MQLMLEHTTRGVKRTFTKNFLKNNPDIYKQLEYKLREVLNLNPIKGTQAEDSEGQVKRGRKGK